jgi:hypothetical protein
MHSDRNFLHFRPGCRQKGVILNLTGFTRFFMLLAHIVPANGTTTISTTFADMGLG